MDNTSKFIVILVFIISFIMLIAGEGRGSDREVPQEVPPCEQNCDGI